jgi:hypothetical protein
MGDRRVAYRFLVVGPEGKSHLEELGIDERIKLSGFSRIGVRSWTGLIWRR